MEWWKILLIIYVSISFLSMCYGALGYAVSLTNNRLTRLGTKKLPFNLFLGIVMFLLFPIVFVFLKIYED